MSFRREPLQIPIVGIHVQTPSLDPSFITAIVKALHFRDCLAPTLHFFSSNPSPSIPKLMILSKLCIEQFPFLFAE